MILIMQSSQWQVDGDAGVSAQVAQVAGCDTLSKPHA